MTITLSALAVTAASSLHGVLLQFAAELEAHKELIEKLETQIQSLHALALDRDVIAQGTTHSITDDIETRFEHLRSKVESVEYAAQNSLGEVNTLLSRLDGRLDDVECSLEDKLNSMDVEERVTEALQNVTFSVTID
jgi:enoyl-[acyl-carrier-protein] reductase (NADH)